MPQGYRQAVLDCKEIMSDLYDEYGDYSVVLTVYSEFCKRAKKLLNERNKL